MVDCGCKNHLGKKKQMHKSAEAALDAILKRHLAFGAHKVYKCPKGVCWHVASVKRPVV